MSVPYKGSKCNCCGIYFDTHSAPSECEGCNGENLQETEKSMITLNTIEKGTKFNTTAVKEKDSGGGDIFMHFESIREHASAWGLNPKDILDVECEIVDNDLSIESIMADRSYDDNCTDYFCCASAEDDGFNVSLIFPNIKLFFMCFPYGCDIERYWQHDMRDENGNIEHRKGDRKDYMMRIKVRELK